MITISNYLAGGQTNLSNLLLENYHKLGLTTEEFMLWIQLYKAGSQGNDFPELPSIAKTMGISDAQVYYLLERLVNLQFVAIKSTRNERGQQKDYYDLTLAFEKLSLLQKQTELQVAAQTGQNAIKELYQQFEKELNRVLSPIEMQTIGQWLDTDHYSPELLSLALKEAVLNQVYNLKYIDKVLLSWERKNIHTKEQVQLEQKRRKEQVLKKETPLQTEELPKVSLHNWLDGGK